jgi:hypothetical protein
VTTQFDSDSSVFFHKISCKFINSLAKLKLSFQNDSKGEIIQPQVTFTSKHLSINYDVEDQNALINTSLEVGPRLQFRAFHDVKVQNTPFLSKIMVLGYIGWFWEMGVVSFWVPLMEMFKRFVLGWV